MKKSYLVIPAVLAAVGMAAIGASAQTSPSPSPAPHGPGMGWMGHGGPGMGHGVFGTVSAINGSTLTITSQFAPKGGTATTYTVDASNATVTKSGAASSVSAIAVGDMIAVQGTVNGTSVTATQIFDGMMKGPRPSGSPRPMPTPVIQGNGEPVVAGTIAAISGSTLTVTNKSNVTYTVDASSAQFEAKNKSASLTDLAVGDNVVVQGAVNGTAISAYSVIDQGGSATTATTKSRFGFLGTIGNFLHSLFGF